MVIASKGPIDLKRAIASTRADCFWIHMQEQLPELSIGILSRPAATIPRADWLT